MTFITSYSLPTLIHRTVPSTITFSLSALLLSAIPGRPHTFSQWGQCPVIPGALSVSGKSWKVRSNNGVFLAPFYSSLFVCHCLTFISSYSAAALIQWMVPSSITFLLSLCSVTLCYITGQISDLFPVSGQCPVCSLCLCYQER